MGSHEDVFTYAIQLSSSISMTMMLHSAIKLKVLDAIGNAGPDAKLSAHEIASHLSISNPDAPEKIDRMLRLLSSHSIVTCTQKDHQPMPIRVYGLTPVAKYFIPNEDGASLGPPTSLLHDKVLVDSWFAFKDSVIEGGIPFNKVHGAHMYEYASSDSRFKDVFNIAMDNHTTIAMSGILDCYHGFNNLKSVVDVGGGLGININMIVSKYPTIKGINFDLPQVIGNAPHYPGVQHVGGDMFKEVPQGDAIFMKWILHNWNDEHCLTLLKNCYKALPADGKVIIVEGILGFLPDSSLIDKVNTYLDVIMLTQNAGGKERNEDEFRALAIGSGFAGMRKECFARALWVMEFYK
ncbi:caffeic acid 3-O-methyltransferase-like [Rutidosis leptorrhynchoides]|uniref:caffeic acid 3-O-methyltransferase-like n=1 Tax=Rutidosis leptorrhynchoides TaxID=125765 RepID=UPI003A9993B4